MLYTICLCIFLLVAGLGMAGVGLPRWVTTIGGIAGAIAGIILLIGIF